MTFFLQGFAFGFCWFSAFMLVGAGVATIRSWLLARRERRTWALAQRERDCSCRMYRDDYIYPRN